MAKRTIFMGTGDIGLPTLRALINGISETELVAVVTGADTLFGRPPELRSPEIKVVAEAEGIPVLQPARLSHIHEELKAIEPDLIVVMAYGQILRRTVLDLPRLACLNLHASILPRHRGASPIQAALLAGDRESGITVMHMARGLDTGDMVHTEEMLLPKEMTGGELHDALADIAPVALERALSLEQDGALPRTPQEETEATYAGKLSRTDGEIDWTTEPGSIRRQIYAFAPWPGTWTTLPAPAGSKKKPKRLKILPPVEVVGDSLGCAVSGTAVAASGDQLIIAAGETGGLRLGKVQAEGSKAMSAEEFLRGSSLEAGAVLGTTSS